VRDRSISTSNYRSTKTLDAFCKEQDVVGISNVDTRQLTRIVRDIGCINGVITDDVSKSDEELVALAKSFDIMGRDLLEVVTRKGSGKWGTKTEAEWEFNPRVATATEKYSVVAYDLGIKNNILNRLTALGCDVTVVPAKTPADEVLALKPDGVFFSNGPVRTRGAQVGRIHRVIPTFPW
jgi:carbamoyl-phosphate synthase small subunit